MKQTFRLLSKPVIAVALLGALAAPATFAQQGGAAAANNPIEVMKAELKITAAQEGDWKKFVEAYTVQYQPSQPLTPDAFNAMKTPGRVAFLKQLHTEQNNFLFKRFDASVALYNALDDDQKKVFDEMTAERPAPAPAPAPKAKARSKK